MQSERAAAILIERIVRSTYPSKHVKEIQPLQWSILRYLQQMPQERCEVRWIASFLDLTRAPVTRAIQTLEKRGLIQQVANAGDKRTKTVTLTAAGIEALKKDPIIKLAKLLELLPPVERKQFERSIREIAFRLALNR